jgi:AcrR family transcriptional regulator
MRAAPDVNPRPYDNRGREAAAAARRERVLAAARDLFVRQGYGKTTMRDIALAAATSVKTVEAAFGTKGRLLKRVIDVAIAGDDERVPVIERPVVDRLREERDPDVFLGLYAQMVTAISERLAPLQAVVEQAAGSDTEIDELRRTTAENRLFGARYMADLLLEKAPERSLATADDVADLFFLFNDPLVYRTLVLERGWSSERFASWLGAAYQRLLWPAAAT